MHVALEAVLHVQFLCEWNQKRSQGLEPSGSLVRKDAVNEKKKGMKRMGGVRRRNDRQHQECFFLGKGFYKRMFQTFARSALPSHETL